MKTDSQIRYEGIQALLKSLGEVDAERFFNIFSKEDFDYTQWQRSLWVDESVEGLSRKAAEHRQDK